MVNSESTDLEGLFNTTFEWLVQHGEPTPAEGVEPELGPDGLAVVEWEASYAATLSAPEVWRLDADAAQILEVDSNEGELILSASEPSYSRLGNGNLGYNPASARFWLKYAASHHLEDTQYGIYRLEDGQLKILAEHTHRRGLDRELFRLSAHDSDPFEKRAGMEVVAEEELDRRLGALESIVNGLREHWPAIKAAREAKPGGEIEPPAS